MAWFCYLFKKRNMKKFNFIAAVPIAVSVFFAACGNGGQTRDTSKKDNTQSVIPPPSDNSSATNPSLADTAYSKNNDTTKQKKDSSKPKY
jgi:hypothetical protein